MMPEAIDWIIDVTCRDRSYGARPLRRAIQRYIEDPLADEVLEKPIKSGSTVLVERDEELREKAKDGGPEERLKVTILPPVDKPPEEAEEKPVPVGGGGNDDEGSAGEDGEADESDSDE